MTNYNMLVFWIVSSFTKTWCSTRLALFVMIYDPASII